MTVPWFVCNHSYFKNGARLSIAIQKLPCKFLGEQFNLLATIFSHLLRFSSYICLNLLCKLYFTTKLIGTIREAKKMIGCP